MNKPSLVTYLAQNFKKELPNFEDFDINKKTLRATIALCFFYYTINTMISVKTSGSIY